MISGNIPTMIDYAVLVASFALSVDIFLQITHIIKRKSSLDISLKGSIIRLIAITTFLIKFIITGDFVLIVGQGLFVFAYAIYFILLLYFRK